MVANNSLLKQTEELKKAATAVFDGNLRSMDLGLRGFALTRKEQLLDPYYSGKRDMPKTFAVIDSILAIQHLDSLKQAFATFKPSMASYFQYSEDMKKYAQEGNLEQYVKLLNEDHGFYLWRQWSPIFHKILKVEDKLIDQAQERYEQAMNRNVLLQIILIVLTIPTLVVVMYKIRRDANNRKKLLRDFEESNKRYLFNSGIQQSSDNAQVIIESSISNLKEASAFIKDVAKGNYSVRWKGLDDNNAPLNTENLAGDLIKMRDQMKKVKELDEKRIWTTEGLAKFSDVARINQNNIENLSNEVVRFITKHLNAQQGTLFILRDDDEANAYLELTACYAFDKKKYTERKIDVGAGLVGQVFLEGKTTILTHVPKNYITITSGLGDATPRCVIIVPMKYNGKVEAVLELASFNKFEEHEIDFLEKAGQVIASSIHSTKTNERTTKLLKETQEQAEALKSQEEELRQNMEELQATHENMRRQRDEKAYT
jgi:CHASE3 domain sensor protein